MDPTSTFYAQDAEDLNVFRDAFAPPSRTTRSKPWDRAPVSAHAPRLQGHKIWKRAGLRSSSNSNKENDTAQVELAREGAGARKKARLQGLKENILDATWKDGQTPDHSISAVGSPQKKDISPTKFGSEDSLVVPRKRTSANHLITPRRRTKRVPMGMVVVGRLSPVTSMTPKEDDIATTEHGGSLNEVADPTSLTPEKPVRRRKSARKSLRRLTTEGNAAVVFTGGASLRELATGPVPDTVPNTEDGTRQELQLPTTSLTDKDDLDKPSSVATVVSREIHANNDAQVAEDSPKSATSASLVCSNDIQEYNLPIRLEQVDNAFMVENSATEVPVVDSAKSCSVIEERMNESCTGVEKISSAPNEAETATNDPTEDISTVAAATPTVVYDSPQKRMRTPRRSKEVTTPVRGSTRTARSHRKAKIQAEQAGNSTPQLQKLAKRDVFSSAAQVALAPVIATQRESREEDLFTETTPKEPQSEITDLSPSDFPKHEQYHLSTIESPVVSSDGANVNNDNGEYSEVVVSEVSNHVESNTTKSLDEEACPEKSSDADNQEASAAFSRSSLAISEAETLTLISEQPISESAIVPEPNTSSSSDDEDPEEFDIIAPSATFKIARDATPESEELAESSTPDPTTTKLVEVISEHATSTKYDEDDTDLLRNFLTRVKANKEAKANATVDSTKRKRSFPHSPMKLPLESSDAELALSPNQPKDEFDIPGPASSPIKRRKRNDVSETADDLTDNQSIRRSGRTRLPVKTSAIPTPNFIPVRRLGQDNDGTVTLRRNEEKDLATLTRVNTRKNKGAACSAQETLITLANEKENPAFRHQVLKQKFEAKTKAASEKKKKSVVWAEEIAQYSDGKKPDAVVATDVEKTIVEEKKSSLPVKAASGGADEKKSKPVRVGVRSSRIAMGMAVTGTPAPKRKSKSVRS